MCTQGCSGRVWKKSDLVELGIDNSRAEFEKVELGRNNRKTEFGKKR